MQKITPFLWFNNNAEEAMNFYTSLFENSKIVTINKYPEGTPGVAGKVMMGSFIINGQEIMVLDGGPEFTFNESFSLFVSCDTQEEVDFLWDKLTSNGGMESQCGWLKDKFGLSWQIIPKKLGELIGSPDQEKSGRALQAMLKMKKIDSAELQKAYDGE